MFKRLFVAVCMFTSSISANASLIVFQDDFNSGSASANFSGFTQVVTSPNGQKTYLGNLSDQTATLSLSDLSLITDYNILEIEFDLYAIRSLDGAANGNNAPDSFELLINNESLFVDVIRAPRKQGISHSGAENGIETAYDNDAFGNNWYYGGATTFHYSFKVFNFGDTLTIDFKTDTNTGWNRWQDEAFGIDNVQVTAVPEPSMLGLLGLALLSLGLRRQKQ